MKENNIACNTCTYILYRHVLFYVYVLNLQYTEISITVYNSFTKQYVLDKHLL